MTQVRGVAAFTWRQFYIGAGFEQAVAKARTRLRGVIAVRDTGAVKPATAGSLRSPL